jgi:hypothetical protein
MTARKRHLVSALALSTLILGACSPEGEVVSSFEWVHYESIDELWAESAPHREGRVRR